MGTDMFTEPTDPDELSRLADDGCPNTVDD
jgi:hypothetical protein